MEFTETIPLEIDADISEAESSKPLEEQKRECTLTLMVEGAGNKRDKHWYTSGAVESGAEKARHRRKMFMDHKDTGGSVRSNRDWASTIKEVWTEPHPERAPLIRARGRVKVHDLELWRRIREAPEEIAVSIFGTGSGKPGTGPDGNKYNRLIEKVGTLKSFDVVSFSGNAPMGAENIQESETPLDSHETEKETNDMDRADVLKTLTEHEIRKECPNLVADLLSAEKENIERAKRQESEHAAMKEAEAAKDAKVTEMETQLKEATDKVTAAEKKADELEAKDALREHKGIVDKLLVDSKLPEKVITERFKERLYTTCNDEDSVKEEIEDLKVAIGEAAKEEPVKDAEAAKVKEEKGKKEVDELKAIREEFGEEPEKEDKD